MTSEPSPSKGPPEDGLAAPLLAIQFRGRSVELTSQQAVVIRDAVRSMDGDVERRLVTLLEAKTTELLAAPLYAGTVTLRIDRDEEAVLLAATGRWVRAGRLVHESPALVRLWAELDGRIDSAGDAFATDAALLALVAPTGLGHDDPTM